MKIGVVGLGGLGHMAVKWGKAFGCEVSRPHVVTFPRAAVQEAVLPTSPRALKPTSCIPTRAVLF